VTTTLGMMGRLFPFPGLGEVESYAVLAVVAFLIALWVRAVIRRGRSTR
jgi:hypothetical protein